MRNDAPQEAPLRNTGSQGDVPRDRAKTSLHESAAAHLQALKDARRELRGVAVHAFFPSRCRACRRRIRVGQLILPIQPIRTMPQRWLHLDCAAKWHVARDLARKAS